MIPEYDTVHGRILAVNMAHLRKKRQMPENSSLGDEVFHGIQAANTGNETDGYIFNRFELHIVDVGAGLKSHTPLPHSRSQY